MHHNHGLCRFDQAGIAIGGVVIMTHTGILLPQAGEVHSILQTLIMSGSESGWYVQRDRTFRGES